MNISILSLSNRTADEPKSISFPQLFQRFSYTELTLDYEDDELNVGDYSVEHTSSELNTEIEMLQKLVEEAEQCRNSEPDAKATALVEKIYSLRSSGIEANNKILVFTEFNVSSV